MFSPDLTIAFVFVTILSVPCSFGGWSLQIQRFEDGEFWVPMCVESRIGWLPSLHAVACFVSSQDSALHRLRHRAKRMLVWKNVRTCADCGPWSVVFQPITGHVKSDSVNNFQHLRSVGFDLFRCCCKSHLLPLLLLLNPLSVKNLTWLALILDWCFFVYRISLFATKMEFL